MSFVYVVRRTFLLVLALLFGLVAFVGLMRWLAAVIVFFDKLYRMEDDVHLLHYRVDMYGKHLREHCGFKDTYPK